MTADDGIDVIIFVAIECDEQFSASSAKVSIVNNSDGRCSNYGLHSKKIGPVLLKIQA